MPSTASSPIRFDYTGARKAGFTDDQIAQSLSAKRAGGVQVFVDRAEVEAYRNSSATATATPAPTAPEPTGPRTLALAPAAPSGSVAPPTATPAGSPSELANTLKPPAQFAAGAVRGAARAAVDFVKSIPGQAEEFYRQGSQAPYLPGETPAATRARGAGYQEAARTIAAYTPLETPIGKVLPLMVAQGGAEILQAGQPVETADGQRPPTAGEVGERVGGGALGLAMGLPGVVHGAVGRVMGKRPIAPTPAEAEAAKANIAPPATLKPQLRSVSEQASQELGRAVDEMQRKGPISFKSNGISIQDAHIVPTLVRVFPEDPNAVRVTVMDNATGEMHSVALPSIAALRGALGQGTRAEIPPAPAERALPPKKRTQEEYAAQQRVIGQAVAQVPEQVAKVRERIATAPAAIEALERQIAENPNDKQVGRWKRRVENLRGLPEPEPGPVEQPSEASLPKGEVAPRGRTEATTPTPVQEPPMAGTKGPVPATGTVVRAESPAPARPKAPPSTPEAPALKPVSEIRSKPTRAFRAKLSSSTDQFVTDGHVLFMAPEMDARVRERLHAAASGNQAHPAKAIEQVVKKATENPVRLQARGWTTVAGERGEEEYAVFHDPKSDQITTVDPQKWKLSIKAVSPDSYEQTSGKPLSAIVMKKGGKVVGLMMPLRASEAQMAEIRGKLGVSAKEPALVTHESRMSGAPATVPRPSQGRGIPIARTAPRVPTKAESVDLPSAEVPELPLRAKAAGPIRKVREALREVVEATNPVRPAVGKNLDLVMRKKGEPKQALFRTEQAQEKVWKFWEESPKSKALDFLNRLESGVQPDPRLAEIDRAYRQRSANVFEAISRWKQLPFWENYFPHMWKDPKKAEVFIQGRRPMEGSKSFLKARQLEDTLAGLKAGLEPVSWNPEELMQMMEHNARKFVTVQELSEEAQSMGSAKRLGIGEKMPEGFRRSNQNWTKIYLNPETPVKEYHDRAIMEGLEGVAKAIGTKLDRQVKIGGRRLGYSEAAPGRTGRVMTKFATPESTLAHEIGHQIDSKYGLQDKFIRKSTPAEKAELRALVDLRLTPGEETTPSFKKYIREGPEKMATLLEALIHAPEAFQKTAPLNYKKFIAFLNSHDELAPLIHIRPSLRLVEGTGTVHAGGIVLGGEIVFQKDLARLLDNHMSKDWVTDSSWGRGFMASRNFLNAVELGFSAFHATGTTILAGMSRASVGISELAHGNPIEAAKKFATTPFAPLSYARTGWKFYKGDPGLVEAIEKEIFTGGASLEKRQYYRNQMIDRFVRNYRRAAARGGTPYERAVGGVKALGQAPFAAIEVPIKLLTTKYIPQMKVGAFRELFSSQMRIKAKDIAQGKDTMENVARLAWRDIEDRFGLINYDNEFWNNGLRSAIMVLIRAPGWKLGTARALGGGALVDMPRWAAASAKFGVEKIKGGEAKPPEWTPRMSFALGMVFTSFSLSAAYQILHTGQAPQNLEDLLHPRNGLRNDDGTPGRINFPTFMRDVQGWTGLTVKGGKVGLKPDVPGFLFGRIEHRGGGSSLFHGGALAPEVTLILDLLENQSYRGPIRDENASNGKQVLQVMRYLFNREQPFSIQQYRALGAHQAARAEQAEAFFGMTPYHEKREKRPTRFRERY